MKLEIGYSGASLTQHAHNHYGILEAARRAAKEAGFVGSITFDVYGDGRWAFRLSCANRVFKDKDGKWALTHKSAYGIDELGRAVAESIEGTKRKEKKA